MPKLKSIESFVQQLPQDSQQAAGVFCGVIKDYVKYYEALNRLKRQLIENLDENREFLIKEGLRKISPPLIKDYGFLHLPNFFKAVFEEFGVEKSQEILSQKNQKGYYFLGYFFKKYADLFQDSLGYAKQREASKMGYDQSPFLSSQFVEQDFAENAKSMLENVAKVVGFGDLLHKTLAQKSVAEGAKILHCDNDLKALQEKIGDKKPKKESPKEQTPPKSILRASVGANNSNALKKVRFDKSIIAK